MQAESSQSTGPTSDDTTTSKHGRCPTPSESISSVPDSPAKIFPMPGKGQDLTASGAACSSTSFAWFDNSDPNSCCWRTWQRCLTGGWIEFLESWPRSGLMRNGIAYRLPPLVRRISGTGFSSSDTEPTWWGTPNAHPRTHTPREVDHGIQLANQVAFYPTPAAHPPGWKNIEVVDKNGNPPEHANQRFYDATTGRLVQKGLEQVVKMFPTPYGLSANQGQGDGEFGKAIRNWPTPRSSMTGGATDNRLLDKERNLEKAVAQTGDRGQLNPTWVEWLMGFPSGWTDLEDSETPSSPKSQSGSDGE